MGQSENPFQFDEFEQTFGIVFENKQLLQQAFTHSSYVNEHRRQPYADNERLEFLGDAVLELTVSRYLFQAYPDMSEGELTKLRAAAVCEPSLVEYTNNLGFAPFILLGKGEEVTGGRERPALLADVFEAFIGALYLDRGMGEVVRFLRKHVFPRIDEGAFSHVMDYKSQLQEYIQRKSMSDIHYRILDEEGPAHDRQFVTEVIVGDERMGIGRGHSKKEAEQQAAQKAMRKLRDTK